MPSGLDIVVFSGFCSAPSKLGAFDRALRIGGAHDANIISLSSIVPAGATVRRGKLEPDAYRMGDLLYCVMAQEMTSEVGAGAWAGISWAVDEQGRGGVFAESEGPSRRHVEDDLDRTVSTLIADRPELDFGPTDLEIVGGVCEDEPVCALTIAAFGTHM